MIDKALTFLYDHLFNCKEVDDNEKKYRYEHSLRVGNIARKIAVAENANVLVCTLAGFLHDVGKFDSETNEEHARVSGVVAREFLETLDLSQKEVNDICYAIATHYDGDAGYSYEKTIEAEIISDADNIDRFSAIRAAQEYWFNQTMEIDSIQSVLSSKIEKLNQWIENMEFSTPTSTRMFIDNLKIQVSIYQALLDQYNMTEIET